MKKYSVRTSQTKDDIREAFWKLYKTKDISKIKVSEVVEVAGYNRSTFYAYYTDVYAILEEIEESVFRAFQDFKPSKSMEDVSREINDVYKTEGEYLAVLISENGDPQFIRKLINYLYPILKEELKISDDDLMFKYKLEYQISGLLSTMSLWFRNGQDTAPEKMIQLIKTYAKDPYE